MIPRGAPYIGWSDLAAAAAHCLTPGDAAAAQHGVERAWNAPDDGQTVACLSVRTGLDALLRVMAWPAGSEIVVSAITIPHVLDILSHHQLVAVPVDLDVGALSVHADDVRAAVTPRTRAILVAHLFGSRMPLDAIAAVARDHDLLLIEDCAQANDGSGYRGHAASDVAMFSFGPIKRQTAMGGAVLGFRDAGLAGRVRQTVASYPRQSRGAYARRIATMAGIKALSYRPVFGAFVTLCRWTGRDHDETLGTALRAFAKGDLFARLRQQPSAPLLATLGRRLRQSPAREIDARVRVVRTVTAEFPQLCRPGTGAAHHTHWLFPMLAHEPERVMRQLWSRGYDATRGASNLVSVPAPSGRPAPTNAERLMREVLYLPLSPSAPDADMRQMARAVRGLVEGAGESEPLTSRPFDRLRFWTRASIGGAGFGLAVGWYIVLRLLPGSNRFRRESFARTMSRLVCRPVGVRVRFVDRDRVSRHHPCVYVANHQSQIDYPILGAIYPGNALVMASQIGDWPFMGALFRSSGSLVLDRDVPHRAVAALEQAERAIRDERLSVWMFAEGTRGKARGQLGPFKRGAFRLAATTGVPVVPIVVSPLKPHTDLRGRRLEPHAVTVRVLEPMYPAGGGRENEDALRDAVRARMQTVLDELSGAALPRGYAARGR